MKIKELRKSRNMTQNELAISVGVERTTVTMWETGNSVPSIDALKKLAAIFNCKIDDLIDK